MLTGQGALVSTRSLASIKSMATDDAELRAMFARLIFKLRFKRPFTPQLEILEYFILFLLYFTESL